MSRSKKIHLEGEIDITRVKRGHQPHKSGAGSHRDKRKKTRQKQREEYLKQGE